MGHADFRVRGKIFATLGWPDEKWGMVKLTPTEQQTHIQAQPEAFVPANGAWGRNGCTLLRLEAVAESPARKALKLAWSNISTKVKAPKSSARGKA